MSTDTFAAAFDAIEINPARTPSSAAIEAAMAMCAPADEPGFYLLDDCEGRFTVDREFGFISLKDDETLETERGQVHAARLKVVEHSGASYELLLRLRISGRVPQVVAEVEASASPSSDEPQTVAPIANPSVCWGAYRGFAGERAAPLIEREDAPFGGLFPILYHSAANAACDLHLGVAAPPAAPANAHWSL